LGWLPIGRFGEPDNMACGVLWLASDVAKYLTGAEPVIDEGWTGR
jgi:NAD(P)-dependent dehydrogenase (short-subunit alcohol dehydrogenase family)